MGHRLFCSDFPFLYPNSFLIKRRKKEFGLYNILGMEKKHISKILFFETLYASVISFAFGFMIGILFYKAAQLLLCQITGASVIGGFYISLETVKNTLILFGIIFILTYLNTLRQIHLSNPIELLKGSQVGEREPRANIFVTLLGIIFLAHWLLYFPRSGRPYCSHAFIFYCCYICHCRYLLPVYLSKHCCFKNTP